MRGSLVLGVGALPGGRHPLRPSAFEVVLAKVPKKKRQLSTIGMYAGVLPPGAGWPRIFSRGGEGDRSPGFPGRGDWSLVQHEGFPRMYWRLAWVLFGLGVSWRALRYLLQFPIWGDEAFISLNLLDRDFVGMTGSLRFAQVAPILFMWIERAAYLIFGGGELALRLVPFLAGLAALVLFRDFVRSILTPFRGMLALGIMAVSYYPVRHSSEIKPYSLDLLMSVALLLVAVKWLREPRRLGWLSLLVGLGPVAVGFSYPSIFIAVTVSLVLLPAVVRDGRGKAQTLYVAFNLTTLAAFLASYGLVGVQQYHSTGGAKIRSGEIGFPPRSSSSSSSGSCSFIRKISSPIRSAGRMPEAS